MATELQKKYEAQFLQVSGFSLMVPLARIILNAVNLKVVLNISFISYFIFSLIFAFIGMILIIEGYSELGEK